MESKVIFWTLFYLICSIVSVYQSYKIFMKCEISEIAKSTHNRRILYKFGSIILAIWIGIIFLLGISLVLNHI